MYIDEAGCEDSRMTSASLLGLPVDMASASIEGRSLENVMISVVLHEQRLARLYHFSRLVC